MYKIFRAEFPFIEDNSKSKDRPVLQLTKAHGKFKLVVVAYITSRISKKLETDIELNKSDIPGLTQKSVVRLHKLSSILLSRMTAEIGELSSDKISEVQTKLKKLLQL